MRRPPSTKTTKIPRVSPKTTHQTLSGDHSILLYSIKTNRRAGTHALLTKNPTGLQPAGEVAYLNTGGGRYFCTPRELLSVNIHVDK